MARKLKVFSWSDGLHDYAVATTSRAKALEAWDVGRDLFKDGTAQEISQGAAHDAALAAPETVITLAAHGLDAALKTLPKPIRARPDKAAVARAAKLAKLGEELAGLEAEARASEADFESRRMALDQEEVHSRARFKARRAELGDAIQKARR
jgi:hypothetical protein